MNRNFFTQNCLSSAMTSLSMCKLMFSARLLIGLVLLSFSFLVKAEYTSSQIENDLSLNSAFERAPENSGYVYVKSQYVSDLRQNDITTLSDFHGWMKNLGKAYMPKPALVPIGVGSIQIFIPTYPVPERAGDKFVQRLMILDQLRYWLGSTVKWTGSSTLSEEDLIKSLYVSGKDYGRQNGLVLGDPLPESQWQGSGHGDIIWPEFRSVHGQKVLVPIVYLTDTSINNYAVNDHITSPSNSVAQLNSLTIGASASMTLRLKLLDLMDGLYVNGSLNVTKDNESILVHGGALDVYGGSITAEENLKISARAISVRPVVIISNDPFGQSQVIGSLASVNAPNGSITFNSYAFKDEEGNVIGGGDIYVEGSQINGKTVTLNAPSGNIDVLATQLRSVSNQVIRGGTSDQSEIEYLSSTISGEEAVDLIAGGEINVHASDLISDKGIINILAGNGIYIENEFGEVRKQMHQKVSKTTRDMSHLQTIAITANLRAGRGIHMNTTSGPIVLRAAEINSVDGTSLNAQNGQVHMLMATEQDEYTFNQIKNKLFTIKTTTESWDKDTPVYTTVMGGLEVNATRGIVVEYGGLEGEDSDAQIEALSKMPGMEWLGEIGAGVDRCSDLYGSGWDDLAVKSRQDFAGGENCIDYTFVELLDKYDYDKSTSLSPAAMAVISIAAAVATGGSSAALTSGTSVLGSVGVTATGAASAMANAAFTTLVTQASIGVANGALNGDSPYDIWKDLGSKENMRQLATSIVTAGAIAYADEVMGFDPALAGTEDFGFFSANKDALSFADQSIQILAHTTVSAGIDVLAQGDSLSDFGGDFHKAFERALGQNVVKEIGNGMASAIGNADLSELPRYLAHAALGCVVQSAYSDDSSDEKSKCYSGGAGAVIGEYLGEQQKADTNKELEKWAGNLVRNGVKLSENDVRNQIDFLISSDVDFAKLSAALMAFVLGGDVNAAADGATVAALYNANGHDKDDRIENAMKFIEKIEYARNLTIYVYTDHKGNVWKSERCPAIVAGCGPDGEELTAAEIEFEIQKKEYNDRKWQHFVDCQLKGIEPCNFNTTWGGNYSPEAVAAVDGVWDSSNGQERLKSVMNEWVRMRDLGATIGAVTCEVVGSVCSIVYQTTKISESGEITVTDAVSIGIGAAPGIGFVVKRAGDLVDARKKVVVGGGRAEGYPVHGSDTITINPDPDTLPDIVGIGQKLPFSSRSMVDVNLEGLRYDFLIDGEGRKFFAEAHRVLMKKGVVRGYTGSAADVSKIRDAMKAVGFKNIDVGYRIGGDVVFSGVKP